MKFNKLIAGFADTSLAFEVKGLVLDSREVKSGDVFIALAGAKQHGLSHAPQAIKQGAAVIIYAPEDEGEKLAAQLQGIPLVKIENLAFKLADIAARFYDYPTKKLDVKNMFPSLKEAFYYVKSHAFLKYTTIFLPFINLSKAGLNGKERQKQYQVHQCLLFVILHNIAPVSYTE